MILSLFKNLVIEFTLFRTEKYDEKSTFPHIEKFIQDEDSNFNQERRDVIKYTIENNLRTAMKLLTLMTE